MIQMLYWGGDAISFRDFNSDFPQFKRKLFFAQNKDNFELVIGTKNGSYEYVEIGDYISRIDDGALFIIKKNDILKIEKFITELSKGVN